jgi:UDP-glucose 4-epimerase
MLPDSLNPRYSYGGSKIVSELIAFNYAREHYRKVQVFRPHNVYGPDMGWKHVLPQFIVRAKELIEQQEGARISFPIQGDGTETRAFCYVDDVVDGIITMYEHGAHREVYHIGNDEMVSIAELVGLVAGYFGRSFDLVTGAAAPGGTRVRCPDISKMAALGYRPSVLLAEGVRRTSDWYVANSQAPAGNGLL